jgi:WXG100 family type VII secretion target
MWAYSVNLQTLDALTSRIADATGRIDTILAGLDMRIAELQSSWHGDAADAQRRAHDEWVSSAIELRQALGDLRVSAERARDNYGAAVDAGGRMWGAP